MGKAVPSPLEIPLPPSLATAVQGLGASRSIRLVDDEGVSYVLMRADDFGKSALVAQSPAGRNRGLNAPEVVGDEIDEESDAPKQNKRAEFTDRQKATIFVRDRALCSMSGKSLWVLDYGASGSHKGDWADHIVPASRGGKAEVSNGACVSSIYNKCRSNNEQPIYLFLSGWPTHDFFTVHEVVPEHIAEHLKRFATLHISDWYFNRAMVNILHGAACSLATRCDGKAFTRNEAYYAKAAWKKLAEWKALAKADSVDGFEKRGLLPVGMDADQELLLRASECEKPEDIEQIMPEIRPYLRDSFEMLSGLSCISGHDGKQVEYDDDYLPAGQQPTPIRLSKGRMVIDAQGRTITRRVAHAVGMNLSRLLAGWEYSYPHDEEVYDYDGMPLHLPAVEPTKKKQTKKVRKPTKKKRK